MSSTNLVPEGIGHEPDLSNLSPAELDQHHRRKLQSVTFFQGIEGARAYTEAHPEAARHRLFVKALAYTPRPAGYDAAVVGLVEQWLTSDHALAETNAADVARLNARLPSANFNPANHFSKPLSKSLLAKVDAVFTRRGHRLDPQVSTMSAVRRAAKAARAAETGGAKSFGSIGTLSLDMLTIGSHSFQVQASNDRPYIRPTIAGMQRRVYLDELEWIVELIAGAALPIPIPSIVGDLATTPRSVANSPGDLATTPVSGPGAALPQCRGEHSPGDLATPLENGGGELAKSHLQQDEVATGNLSDRIRRLVASSQAEPPPRTVAPGTDPLEI